MGQAGSARHGTACDGDQRQTRAGLRRRLLQLANCSRQIQTARSFSGRSFHALHLSPIQQRTVQAPLQRPSQTQVSSRRLSHRVFGPPKHRLRPQRGFLFDQQRHQGGQTGQTRGHSFAIILRRGWHLGFYRKHLHSAPSFHQRIYNKFFFLRFLINSLPRKIRQIFL